MGGGGELTSHTIFEKIISLENLLRAWNTFRRGKMRKPDVLSYNARLEYNLFELHAQLSTSTYCHDPYEHFYVHDPKRRYISKATVKDRIVHQAIVQVLEPIFEKQFIFDSYASRQDKGVHAAVQRLAMFLRNASRNYYRPVYALKCDIQKFYDSVRHDVLLTILAKTIIDERMTTLLRIIVESYASSKGHGFGLPLGNVTSQLFTNIYLNTFDHFVKEKLRMRWYVRFCDDFVIVHPNYRVLECAMHKLGEFLRDNRALSLHPQKVEIRKFSQGIDFVGQVLRPHYRVLRTKTKRRVIRRIRLRVEQYQRGFILDEKFRQSLQAGLGIFKHGSNYQVRKQVVEGVQKRIEYLWA